MPGEVVELPFDVFAVGEQRVDAVVGLGEQRFDLGEACFRGDVCAGECGAVLFEFGDTGDESWFRWAVRHCDGYSFRWVHHAAA